MKRYCNKCKKHTAHTVMVAKAKTRGSARPLSRFSKSRMAARGTGTSGMGNHGKFSKPPIKKWKMTNKKTSKKVDLRYMCGTCKKSSQKSEGFRTRKFELV